MTEQNSPSTGNLSPASQAPAPPPRPPRLWPAVVLIVLYWLGWFLTGWLELTTFEKFGARMLIMALTLLLFLAWWMISRRVSWTERLIVLAIAAIGLVFGGTIAHPTLRGAVWPIVTVPAVLTSWAIWWAIARRMEPRVRAVGLVAVLLAIFATFACLRIESLTGEQQIVYHLRWSPTAEEAYLARLASMSVAKAQTRPTMLPAAPLVADPGDWPGFRGINRDGEVHNLTISTDWDAHPPALLWRHPIGPGWSSMAVVAGRLFTQEQRGSLELVSCYDTSTGSELWTCQDSARFMDNQSGAGPRATPTFFNGEVFTLGAAGTLNCLDATTGQKKWSRNIAADANVAPPIWGFASSPLVTHGMVIVNAGGTAHQGLLAYHADSGLPAWTAATGESSYTSAQLINLGGEEQVLFFSDGGLIAVDPDSGKLRWEYPLPVRGAIRAVQPRATGPSQILITSETDLGAALLDVAPSGQTWTPTRRWVSRAIKPSFNDLVTQDGFIYGFDGSIFTCVDLQTGKRRWRDGQYDHGQVLLLADQHLLLVVTEEGDAVLVAATPDAHREVARFKAINGKAWNHPAIARGRLFVRSDQEIACYQLGVKDSR